MVLKYTKMHRKQGKNTVFSPYLWCFDDNLNELLHIESSGRQVRLFIIVIIIIIFLNITLQTEKKRNFVLTAMFPKFYIKINLLFAMKTPNFYIILYFNFLCVFIKFSIYSKKVPSRAF